jgi:hypothetical protein
MDFTLKTYHQLLHTLQQQGFVFQIFSEFLQKAGTAFFPSLLRHRDPYPSTLQCHCDPDNHREKQSFILKAPFKD